MQRIRHRRNGGKETTGTPAPRDAALVELIRQTPLLYRVLSRCGIPPRDREELAQDTLLHAVSLLQRHALLVPDGGTLPDAVSGWVTTLATMRACNYRTAASRRVVNDNDTIAGVVAHGPDPEAQAESAALVGALGELTDGEHQLLMMLGLGFTHAEIAAQAGCEASAVEGRIQRARRAFCEAVKKAVR